LRHLTSLLAGTIFGMGLAVSLMVQPQKVLGFLNVAGSWDPTLLVVFAFALITYAIGFPLISKQPLFDKSHMPTKSEIDPPLIIGASLFGIGWGLIGLCPGPAITNLITGNFSVILFVLAMTCGMYLSGAVKQTVK
jgi:uncharacterized protein